MNRDYETGTRNDVVLFTGTEVENTPALGMKTLFVVGLHNSVAVINIAKNQNCTHIYLGANQSFDWAPYMDNDSSMTWNDVLRLWDKLALDLLEAGFLVTLDFDVVYVQHVVEMTCNEHLNFIPQISVKIPYAQQLNYNTTVKIDDKGFKASNAGVWCHSLHSLLDRKTFTSWKEYEKDQPL